MASFSLLRARETGTRSICVDTAGYTPVCESIVRNRFCVASTLEGHGGCVNRMAWSPDGSALLSGSDDTDAILWRWRPSAGPWAMRTHTRVETGHAMNIFGVAFLPAAPNSTIMTGGMDGQVRMHVLDATGRTTARRRAPRSRMRIRRPSPVGDSESESEGGGGGDRVAAAATTVMHAGEDRVKAVEVCDHDPYLFWAGIEDGTVQQFDTRAPPRSEPRSAGTTLVSLNVRGDAPDADRSASYGRYSLGEDGVATIGVKHIAISPARPWYLAVACSDPWVRVFDRRKLPATDASGHHASYASANDNVLRFSPLLWAAYSSARRARPTASVALLTQHTTHVSFHPDGRRMLASYHNDGAYVFDVLQCGVDPLQDTDATYPLHFPVPQPAAVVDREVAFAEAVQPPIALPPSSRVFPARALTMPPTAQRQLPAAVQAHKAAGNEAFKAADVPGALKHYSLALEAWNSLGSCVTMGMLPELATIYGNRAMCYIRRGRAGDSSQAALDCYHAVCANPAYWKVHVRLAKTLKMATQKRLAILYLQKFLELCPSGASASADANAAVEEARKTIAEWERADNTARGTTAQSGDGDATADLPESLRAEPGIRPDFPFDALEPLLNAQMQQTVTGPEERTDGATAPSWPAVWPRHVCASPLACYNTHANIQTDIKEAAFWSPPGVGLERWRDLVVVGNDNGHVIVYNAASRRPLVALRADSDVANCVQPHPTLPVLATSGIEDVIRLWAPGRSVPEADDLKTAGRSPLAGGARGAYEVVFEGEEFQSVLDDTLPRRDTAAAGLAALLERAGGMPPGCQQQ